GFWARAGALRRRRKRFEKIRVAVDRETRFGDHNAFAGGRLDQDHAGYVAAVRFFGEPADSDIFFKLAQSIGNFIFVADIGEAFEFAGGGGRHHILFAGRELFSDFGHEGGDVAVIASGRLSLQRALRGALSCYAEMFHSQARRELHSERPFFIVEDETIRRFAERAFGSIERFPQAPAV